ncbi:MAG: hypothetical protein HC906_18180 [Bacteroidales bacterium]|nr:hypothetical protein [Bacteroidales bacterium]
MTHLHTPYSFSAFNSISQAVHLGVEQGVRVLGINDFFTTKGYEEWAITCKSKDVFPLFNIEFIGLSKPDQKHNIRINDPSNPGRIYLSGKGLSFPFTLEHSLVDKFNHLTIDSNHHTEKLCSKLNEYLEQTGVDIYLDFNSILKSHTKGMVRERHLAKVLHEEIVKLSKNQEEKTALLNKILRTDKAVQFPDNAAFIENEIRNSLLKAGGAAYIPEAEDSFLSVEKVKEFILKGGGIPTYPYWLMIRTESLQNLRLKKMFWLKN